MPTPASGPDGSADPSSAAPPVAAEPKKTSEIGPLGESKPFSEKTGYPSAPYYYAGDGFNTPEAWYGIGVEIQVGNPTISKASGTHSLGQIAAATPNVEYSVELGWHRDEGFGTGSRLFTYINKDKYTSNGKEGGDCYNCITPQVGAIYTQNQEMPAGKTYLFAVEYTKGSWWFWAGGSWIGHESGTFWSSKFTSAKWLPMWGEVYDATGPNSQMGNGIIGTKQGRSSCRTRISTKKRQK